MMTDWKTRSYATPDGLTLVGDVGGPDGANAVVLLHGGGQTRHSWAGAMTSLVDAGYHVVNYDARGHGDSAWSPVGDYSLPALASDLKAVLSAVNRPSALVGASMGGMASFFAIGSSDHPIAEALVMVDIVLRPAPAGVERIVRFMTANSEGFKDIDEALKAVSLYNPDRPQPPDASGLLRNLRVGRDGRLLWHWDPAFLSLSSRSGQLALTKELARVSHNVTLPTLLVRGGNSDIVDDDGVSELRALVPQTEVYDVRDAGHMVAGDRNDGFNRGVIDFLERHFPQH